MHNVFSKISDLQPDGSLLWTQFGGLKVHGSQYNIGHEVYARWLERGKFGENRDLTHQKLNLMFVGPSYSDLRDQTVQDIAELAEETKMFGEKISRKQLIKTVKNIVFNSSCLKGKKIKKRKKESNDSSDSDTDNEETEEEEEVENTTEYDQTLSHIPFLNGLLSDTNCENLHLLIHDEAHWGIKVDSLLEKFFTRVLDIMNGYGSNPRPTLLILLVSATSEVLFNPVKQFDTTNFPRNPYSVNWNYLTSSRIQPFAAHDYRSVEHLSYCNDVISVSVWADGTQKYLTEEQKQTHRTTCVRMQYVNAALQLAQLINNSFHAFSLGLSTMPTYAHYALAALLYTTAPDAIDKSQLGSYISDSPRNKIVLVRVSTIADAKELAVSVKAAFNSVLGFVPFEVITLGGNEILENQLSTEAKKFLRRTLGQDITKNSRIASLHGIPAFVVVVRKLSMGERLPSSCCFYDVRVPYRGCYGEVFTGTHTKFVQDVGRLAGHKKLAPMPIVFVSLNADKSAPESPERSGRPSPMPTFKLVHALLTPAKSAPNVHHTEHQRNKKIYSQLVEHSVLLNASPQIGKTGAFLSLVKIIFDKHIINGAYVPARFTGEETDGNISPNKSLFDDTPDFGSRLGVFYERCKYLRHILLSKGIAALKEEMSGDYFQEFHQMLLESRISQERNTNDLIIINFLTRLTDSLNKISWKVVDCGCGMHGFAPALNVMLHSGKNKSLRKLSSVFVRGIDLDAAVLDSIPPAQQHPKLTFDQLISDVLSVPNIDDTNELYDMVIFNCSLWYESSFKSLSWAYQNLHPGGHLVIVELKRRLPSTWKADMLHMGWVTSDEFDGLEFCIFEYEPYVMSLWQKGTANELNNEYDLLMVGV